MSLRAENKHTWTRWLWLLAPFAWMAVIYWFSAQSRLPHPREPLLDLLLGKGAHMAEYAVLAGLWWRALSVIRTARRGSLATLLAVTWTVTVLYAASDEYHQLFVPGRHGRVTDVGIDAAGALLAVVGLWVTIRRRATRSKPRF